MDYLSNQTYLVQVDSNYSSILYSNFGVLQGSILGQVLFNLCVADMKDCLPNCTCLQSADDLAIYQPCSVKDLKAWCINIEKRPF